MFQKFIFFCLLLIVFDASAQQKFKSKADKSFAKELFDNQNYKSAMDEYLMLIAEDSNSIVYKHNLAVCYLHLNLEKEKTIALLEFLVKQPKADPNAWYDLGLAYHRSLRLDDAIKSYEKFIVLVNKKDKNYIPAARQIEMCKNAKELMQHPVNVSFENIGKEVNSISPDFRPYVTADESMLVFTSKRSGNTGNLTDYDGFNTADIFISNYTDKWSKPKRLPAPLNTLLAEDCCGLTPDGNTICIHYENEKMLGDILLAEYKSKRFQRPLNVGTEINTDADETAACLSPDKQLMFFASNRKQGYGAKDIYYSKKLSSGAWSEAVNLGGLVNTEYDENYPSMSPDGKYLYFCSVGHNSMGGYDIFRTSWDDKTATISDAVNLGYPVNTAEDERSISFTASGRYAYMDASRTDDIGNRDIYRLCFNDIPPTGICINGKIAIHDTLQQQPDIITKISLLNLIKINVVDKNTGLLKANNTSIDKSAKYNLTLQPGNYLIKFQGEMIHPYEYEMIIPDREIKQLTINKDIILILKN